MGGNEPEDPSSYFYEIVKVGSNWFPGIPLVTICYTNQNQGKLFTFTISFVFPERQSILSF